MAKTLVDMDEEELHSIFSHALGDQGAKEAAQIIRRMIKNALLEAGVKSND